jgi:hypothetical protein
MLDAKNDELASSFSLPVHHATTSTSSFTATSNIHNEVNTQWLADTSTHASRLVAQRSNVELLCLFTCLNKAGELQEKGEDGPKDGNDVWITNIQQWANSNKTLALQSSYVCAFFKKYGFALYHNVANDRSFSSLYSSVTYYSSFLSLPFTIGSRN